MFQHHQPQRPHFHHIPWAHFAIAVAVAFAGFCPGYFYYKAKTGINTVVVKGLAEMDVKADLAVWDIKYVTTSNDIINAQKTMEEQTAIITDFLQKNAGANANISYGRLETNDLMANPYRGEAVESARFILSRTITVSSSDVDAVEKALSKTGELVAKGIIFDAQSMGYPVSYIFTKLNDIKPQMLKEATQNAKEAALEFAKSSGSKVGKIHYANQGIFSILPQEESANAVESQQINKKVRVVSTVEYWLD